MLYKQPVFDGRQRFLIFLTVWLAVALIDPTVSADIYRYIDADGTVRYTNDIARVPEDRLSTVQRSVETRNTPADQTAGNPWPVFNESDSPKTTPGVPTNEAKKSALDPLKLRKEKEMLEAELKEQIHWRNTRKGKTKTKMRIIKLKERLAEIDQELGTDPAESGDGASDY